MSKFLSPGSEHTMELKCRYGRAPFLADGESLALVSATVNGVAAPTRIDGDSVMWDISVPSNAAPGSRLVSIVTMITDASPPREDSRQVVNYVGVPAAVQL